MSKAGAKSSRNE